MEFWERVKEEVRRQNTTQEWLARNAGLNFRTFQGWITKEIMPNVDQAVAIARVLGVSVERLVSGEGGGLRYTSAGRDQTLEVRESSHDSEPSDPWLREHRQLIEDLKALDPAELAGIEVAVHGAAEAARAKRKASISAG